MQTQVGAWQVARGNSAVWTLDNTVLMQGQIGLETDTGLTKMGDGATAWNSLAYWTPTMAQLISLIGAGFIGFSPGSSYGANTVGNALQNVSQNSVGQANTAFTTGGTGSAYTLNSGQGFMANAAKRRFNATFNVAGSGAPTLQVDTAPALPLVCYGANGALVAYQPTAGEVADVIADATASYWVVANPLIRFVDAGGRFKNLQVTYGQSSGTVTVTCDECTVSDLNGNQTRLTAAMFPSLANGTLQAALSTVNAINGTDGCVQTAGNFYAVFVAYNPTANMVGLVISSELTGNTLPENGPVSPINGYTQYAFASANKIKATSPSYWLPGIQNGSEFTPTVGSYLTGMVPFVSGTIGNPTTPTYVSQAVRGNGNYIPYHASTISITVNQFGSNGALSIAPNASYGASTSSTNPPPFAIYLAANAYYTPVLTADFNLESNSLYVAAISGYYSFVYGWTLNM